MMTILDQLCGLAAFCNWQNPMRPDDLQSEQEIREIVEEAKNIVRLPQHRNVEVHAMMDAMMDEGLQTEPSMR
jgi:hypothetical protein